MPDMTSSGSQEETQAASATQSAGEPSVEYAGVPSRNTTSFTLMGGPSCVVA